MALEVEAIKEEDGREGVQSEEDRSSVIFDVRGVDSIVPQLYDRDGISSWPTSLVVTCEASLDTNNFAAFPSGALTFSAFGLGEAIAVLGLSYVRFRVSTKSSAGHGLVGVRVNGISDV